MPAAICCRSFAAVESNTGQTPRPKTRVGDLSGTKRQAAREGAQREHQVIGISQVYVPADDFALNQQALCRTSVR